MSDENCFHKVIIKEGWEDAGKIGEVIGEVQYLTAAGQEWTPVLWDGDEDPSWCKSAGLRPYVERDFQAMNRWICINKETGLPDSDQFYEEEQSVNGRYKCIPVAIVPRKAK